MFGVSQRQGNHGGLPVRGAPRGRDALAPRYNGRATTGGCPYGGATRARRPRSALLLPRGRDALTPRCFSRGRDALAPRCFSRGRDALAPSCFSRGRDALAPSYFWGTAWFRSARPVPRESEQVLGAPGLGAQISVAGLRRYDAAPGPCPQRSTERPRGSRATRLPQLRPRAPGLRHQHSAPQQ